MSARVMWFSGMNGRFKHTGKRGDIFLATKFGFSPTGIRGDPDYIRQQVEKSLKALGVETIDLYYAHRCVKTVLIELSTDPR